MGKHNMAIKRAIGNPLDATKQEIQETYMLFRAKAKESHIPLNIALNIWNSYQKSVKETKKEVSFCKIQ